MYRLARYMLTRCTRTAIPNSYQDQRPRCPRCCSRLPHWRSCPPSRPHQSHPQAIRVNRLRVRVLRIADRQLVHSSRSMVRLRMGRHGPTRAYRFVRQGRS